MISLDKLIHQLSQCKDTSIILPNENENINSKFIQKTAVDIRKMELECIETIEVDEDINRLVSKCTVDDFNQQPKENKEIKENKQNIIIPSKSLIIYNENECASIPEILTNIFKLLCFKNKSIKITDWYIYGVRNPESFYKSFMLLTQIDFIIKNKIEKKNAISTFKREMALQYENFYKALQYKKYHFSKHNMINNLTNVDNYNDIDIFQYIADYTKTNFILLDIINEQYFNIQFNPNNLINEFNNQYGKEYVIIIKYSYNTFLPLMNSNGQHSLDIEILNIIKTQFERINYKGYNTDSENLSRTDKIIECDSIILNDVSNTSVIEDMIQINDQEEDNNQNNVETDITNIDNRIIGSNPIDLNSLMNKIPSKINIKNTHKTIDIIEVIQNNNNDDNNNSSKKEELKPLSKYTLHDLQMLAKLNKISTQKQGKQTKPINKTKEELYNELLKIIN